MADTTFTDGSTVIVSAWLNEINDFYHTLFNGDATAPADGEFVVGDGSKFVRESGATARTSLGLGSLATLSTATEATGGTNQTTYTQGDILYATAANTLGKLALGTADQVVTSDGTDTGWDWPPLVQAVEGTPYTTYSSTTTTIPIDDTIPQNTEGVEYVTVSITPKNSAHRLVIEASADVLDTAGATTYITGAIFQDSTASALAANILYMNTFERHLVLRHEMAAGTTSATTFKFRMGPNSGTLYVNGNASGRFYGGVAAVRIRVTEYS